MKIQVLRGNQTISLTSKQAERFAFQPGDRVEVLDHPEIQAVTVEAGSQALKVTFEDGQTLLLPAVVPMLRDNRLTVAVGDMAILYDVTTGRPQTFELVGGLDAGEGDGEGLSGPEDLEVLPGVVDADASDPVLGEPVLEVAGRLPIVNLPAGAELHAVEGESHASEASAHHRQASAARKPGQIDEDEQGESTAPTASTTGPQLRNTTPGARADLAAEPEATPIHPTARPNVGAVPTFGIEIGQDAAPPTDTPTDTPVTPPTDEPPDSNANPSTPTTPTTPTTPVPPKPAGGGGSGGGGSGGGGAVTPPAPADPITRYAESNTNPVPVTADYVARGITGVTDGNVASINTAIDAAGRTDVDTAPKLQAIVDAMLRVIAYADDSTANPAPDEADFALIHVTGVTPDNLIGMQAALEANDALSADTVPEIQAIVTGMGRILDYAADAVANPAPSVADYAAIAVTGVDAARLGAVNSAIAAVPVTAVETPLEIQSVADAMVRIFNYAADHTTAPAPSVGDFSAVGVTGVTAANHAAMLAAVAAQPTAGADSVPELQGLVDVTAPTVVGVSATNIDNIYRAGDVITIEVTLSEAVTVSGGVPTLTLETGATDRQAVYTAGSGTNVLVFTYTVQPGDLAPDLDYVDAFALAHNGAFLTDGFGNFLDTTLPAPGAAGSLSANKAIEVDTFAPPAPVITSLDAGSDTGVSATDRLTQDATPTIHGTALPGVTVEVFDGTTAIGTTTADGAGNWSFTPTTALADGSHGLRARAIDSLGNDGPYSTALTVVVDTTAPAAPVIVSLDAASDTGASATDGVTQDTTPTVVGTATPNARIEIFEGTTSLGTTTADAAGNWTLTVSAALLDGAHPLTAMAFDEAGNASAASLPRTFTVDTTAPAAPAITGLAAGSDTGSSASDRLTNDDTPTLTGTAEANATVQVFDGATLLGTTTADGTGAWSFTPTTALSTGSHSLTARALDAAGNTGVASAALSVTIDTAAAVPTVAGLTPATDTGLSNSDNITADDTPSLTGTAEAGTLVRVFDGTSLLGTTTADGGGNWTLAITTPLSGGTHAITATSTDAAGNVSAASVATSVFIDNAVPLAPVITGLTAATDLGVSATDGLTSVAAPTIVGTAEAHARVEVYDGTTLLGTTNADGTGAWSYTPAAPLSAGSHSLTAKAIDAVSNVSPASAPKIVTIDQTAPGAPSFTGLQAGMDTGTSPSDGITGNARPTLVGTGEAGTRVEAFVGTTAIGSATVDAGGNWAITPTSPLAAGSHVITIKAMDAAGNLSAASAPRTVTVDTGAPAAPVIAGLTAATDTGASSADGITSLATPTLRGTAEADATVRIFDGTTLLGTTTANASGDWTFVPTAPLAAGSHILTAIATDAAGHVSPTSAPTTVVVDAVAPGTATVTGLSADTDTGPSNGDGVTGNATPRLIGTAEPGATVSVFDGGVLLGTTVATASGAWSFTPSTALSGGTHTITARATDAAGNAGALSAAKSITIDASVPPTPTLSGLSATTDTGSSNTDGITANARPTVVGTASANAQVQIFDGTTLLGTTTADGTGAWSFIPASPLAAGLHNLTAKAINASGNASAASAALAVTIDASAPGAPAITGLDAGSDTGASAVDGITSVASPTLVGTAEANATLQLFDGTTLLGTTTADASGNWSFTPPAPLAAGAHALTAVARDASGQASAPSAPLTVTVDASAPASPVITGLTASTDTGVSDRDGVTTLDTPTLTGTAEPHAVVAIFDGGTAIGTATADATGGWSFTPATALTPGSHSLTAVATDGAGNASAASGALLVTVDAGAPGTPTVTGLLAGHDTGLSATDGITRIALPTLVGTADAGATVLVFEGATLLGTTMADGSGNWSLTLVTPLSAGAHAVTARSVDAAGNQSAASTAFTVTVDATGPATPVITGLDAGSDTGVSSSDGITSQATPTLRGTAEADSTIVILEGTTVVGTTTADGNGDWSFTPTTALAPGVHSFTAIATDTAGNTSGSAAPRTVVIDGAAPAAPMLIGLTAGTDSGASATDGLTQDTTPTLTGTGEPGASIEILDGATSLGTVTVGPAGSWSFTPTTALSAGSHTITAIATDAAGRTSAASAALTVTIDTAAAGAPVLIGLTGPTDLGASSTDGITSMATPTVAGTAEADATVQVFDGTTLLGTTVADGTGAWTFTPTTALSTGSHTLTASYVDRAGNPSGLSAPLTITIDASTPGLPTITGLTAASDTGVSATDALTSATTPTILGTAEANATVQVFDGAILLGTSVADGTGAWSFTPTTALTTGSHTLTVVAVDAAGNMSPGAAPRTIQIDASAPAVPGVSGLTAATDTGVSATDSVTSQATPTLVGTAEAGSTVQIFDGTTLLGTVTASAAGGWSLALSAPLADGPHTVTAIATDAAGNVSAPSAGRVVLIDTTPPTAPVITGLTAATDTGGSATDGVTANATPTLTGTAEAGATLRIFDGTTLLGTTVADGTGAWSFTPTAPLAAGSHVFKASILDLVGNTSPDSAPVTVTVDVTAPTAPTLGGLGAGADTGVSATDGLTRLDTPEVVGTAEPGATVRIYDGTTLLGSTTADGTGNWSFTPTTALGAGAHTLTVVTADAAGNVSAVSAAQVITVDAIAPATPVLSGLTPATDTGVSVVDGKTGNATPTFMGTAEPGATIEVLDGTTVLGTATADASGNWTFTPSTALAASAHTITVRASDAAGNVSAASGAVTITIDGTAPAVPAITGLTAATDTGNSNTDGLTANATPTLAGTAEAGAIVQVYDGATLLGTTVATAGGTWSFTPPTAFATGGHTLTARAVDAAGNTSAASPSVTVTVDTTAPGAATVTGLTAASDTGASATDRLTTHTTPTFTGTADANGLVQIYDGNTLLGTTTADGTGAWSFTPTTALALGVHPIRAVGVDAAGNAATTSAALSVTIDGGAPTAPVIAGLATGSDSGPSATDAITSDTTPTLTGTAEAGATIKIFDGAAQIGTVTADPTGAWSFTTAVLTAGAHTLTATATDATGGVSPASTALVVTIDATAPAAPVVTGLSTATDTGASTTDRITGHATPTIVGTAEANATVQVFDGATLLGTTTADGTGAWSFTPTTPLTVAAHTLTARAVDAAGNTSAASASRSLTIDQTAPTTPTVAGLTTATDTGSSNTDGITSNTTPVITGTAEAGSTVKVYDGTTLIGTVTATAGGTWSLTPGTALASGAHSLTATASDVAGNVSAVSVARAVTIDATAPTAPVITGLGAGMDTGGNTEDGATQDDTPTLAGTADPFSTVKLFDGTTLIATVTADAAGAWSFTPTTAMTAGAHTLTATATDVAGNVSPTSAAKTITIDAVGPGAPAIVGLTAATDTGTSSTDGITAQVLPTLRGTAEANATVRIYDGATLIGTAAADATGVWSFTPTTVLTDAAHTFTAEAVDASGNVGPVSTPFTLTIDTVAPVAAVITGLDPSTDLGDSATDGITSDTTPTFVGTAEANATVQIYDGGTLIGTTTADGTGAWTYTPTTVLAAGSHSVTARAVDAAGNEGPASAAKAVTIDATKPGVPTITGLSQASDSGRSYVDNITTDTTPTLVGTAEVGAKVEIFDGGVSLGTTTANASGDWTFTIGVLGTGPHTFTAKASDAAGGQSNASTARTVTIDTTAPAAGVVSGLGTGGDTGSSTSDGITNNNTPQIKGTAEGHATVQVYDGTTLLGTTTAAAGGAWTFTPSSSLASGPHSITIKATDAAGNAGPASSAFTFTVDTVVPNTPTMALDPASDTGANTTDGITDDTTPTFTGTAEAGSSVKIYDNGTLKSTVTADGTGNWTYTSTTLTAGTHAFTATSTDTAGNVSVSSNTVTVEIDTASVAPTVTGLVAATDTGASNTDGITFNTRPTLEGTAEALSTVKIFDGTTQIGTVQADSTGAWSFTPTTALTAGSHGIRVSYTDSAGNTSAQSAAKTIVVDTTGTPAPTITGLQAATDSGSSSTDRITDDTTPTFTGTAEGNATVEFFDGTKSIGTTTAAANGTWTFTPGSGLANGVHSITAVAFDTAGNSGPASTALKVTIDTGNPATPIFGGLTPATDTGAYNDDRVTSTTKPTFFGTAEAGTTITVFSGTTLVGTTTAGADGAWQVTSTQVLSGTSNIKVTSTDLAGNSASSANAPVTITGTPTVAMVNSNATKTSFVPGEQIPIQIKFSEEVVVDLSTGVPTLTLETGAIDRKAVYTAGSGTDTLTFTYDVMGGDTATDLNYVAANSLLLNGGTIKSLGGANATLTLPSPAIATAEHLANNEALKVTNTLPTKPVIFGLDTASNTGSSATDLITSDTTPTITGVAPASTVITIKDGTLVKGTTTSDAAGNWSFTFPTALTSANHTITATSAGGVSTGVVITVDTAAPSVPVVAGLSVTTDLGSSNTDAITSETQPVIRGTSQADMTIEVFRAGVLLGTTTSSSTGAWTFALGTALAAGNHVFTAKATDSAGNTSAASAGKTVTIETTAPAAPVITGLTAATDTGKSNSDGITDDTTPTFTGTAEAGATVTLHNGPTVLGTATANASGVWAITSSTLAAGSHTVVARATDTAGNVSPDSTSYTATIATATPTKPVVTGLTTDTDTGVSAIDGITKDSTPTVTGTADPGISVQVLKNGVAIGTVTADSAGVWTLPVTTALTGSHTITAIATDAAGNPSATSTSKTITFDGAGATVTSVTSAQANGEIGAGTSVAIKVVFSEDIVVDTTSGVPTLTLETGTTDRKAVYTAGSGTDTLVFTYVVQPGDTSADLNYTATSALALNGATLSDLAGNTVSVTLPATGAATSLAGTKGIVVDTTTPAVPVITGLTTGTDTGASNTDGITTDATPNLVGTAEAGATVLIFNGTTQIDTATASSTGAWQATLPTLAAGTHLITARAVDKAGNTGNASTAFSLTVDTTDPTGHTFAGFINETDSGLSNSDEITSDTTPTLYGTAEAGATVDVYRATTQIGTTTADDSGQWSFTPTTALTEGTHSLSIRVTDLAGNQSTTIPALTVEIDKTAPTVPVLTGLTAATDTGTSTTDLLTKDTTPTFTGTAQAGVFVQVYDGATLLGQVTANATTGAWAFTPTVPLANGAHAITVKAADEAGNTSAASAAKTVTIDAALSVPVIVGLTAASDTGSSSIDGLTTATTPTLTGTADPSTTVQIFNGTTQIGTATASAAGAWSFTPTTALAAGTHNITVKGADSAGNTTIASPVFALTVDLTAPSAPTFIGVAAASDMGLSPTDGLTNDTTPTLVGTAEAFATVKIFRGTTLVGTTTADEAGLWSYTPTTAFAAMAHSLTATATDRAGNVSVASSALTVTVDTTAPGVPVLTGLAAGSDTGSSATDGLTSNDTPTLVGTAEANAVIQVMDGGVVVGSTTANGTGAWSFTFTQPLAVGAHPITIKAMDAAGNVSAVSAARTITIDGAAPALPVITGLTAATDTGASSTDGITSNTRPSLTGTAEAGATVQIFDGGTPIGAVTANATTGAWTFTPATALSAGSHALTAQVVDAAGNTSPTTGVWTLVVDPTAPAAPIVTGLTPATDTGFSATDGITSLGTPTLVGTAEPNVTVQVLDGATVLGTAIADGAGFWSFTPGTALAAGAHTITARAIDLADNTSASSAARTVTIDATAPVAPSITGLTAATDTGLSATDGITSATTPTLSGTAEANIRVLVYDGATLLGTTTANGTGAWTFTPTTALAAGAHSFTAVAADAAGQTSPASTALAVTVDAVAPATPVLTGLTTASDTGVSSADGLTSIAMPTLTGTADANAIVKIFDGTTLLGTTTADGTGAWSFTPTTALSDGGHHLTAVATDVAGNASAASAPRTVVVDAAVPVTPVLIGLTTATDTGSSNADGVTANATPTFLGTAEAGSTVRILDGGALLGTVTADVAGNWTFTPTSALTAGAHAITVESRDAAGNASAASTAKTITIDASAAAAPVITGLSSATDTGVSGVDGITKVATPTIVGTGEPNAAVKVFDGAVLLGTTAADASGNWSFTPTTALTVGAHTITATMTDLAGNVSPASAAKTLTVDTATPATPVLTGLTAATDTGASPTDGLTANATPTLTGTAEPGSTVQVYDGTTLLGTTVATAGGTWSYTVGTALTAGSHTLTVTSSDPAGNVSAASAAKTVVVDAVAPNAPTVTGLTAATDTGASNADGVTSNDTPTITGAAEAGSTVKVYDGVTLLGTVTADAAGTWSLTPGTALAEGAHNLTATATDAAGNLSAASVVKVVTIDTIPPAAPVVSGLTADTDLGASATDRLTANARPTFAGTAEAGATVQVFDGGTLLGSTTADGTGAWTFTPATALAAGSHTITAAFTDLIGNTSPTSAPVTVTIDTTGPAVPVITGLTAATDTGASSTDGITTNATPTITGTADANATVQVFDGGTLLGTATANGSGAWSLAPGTALSAGLHGLTAIAADAAGNTSAASAVRPVTIDGAAPAAPVVTGLTAGTDTGVSPTDGVTSNATPALTGSAEPGSTVQVFDGATLLGSATADATGAWTFTPGTAFSAGSHTITATATDMAGRVSGASAAATVTIVAATPTPPVITGLAAGSDTGTSSTDDLTQHAAPTLTGTADPGATLRVYEGASLLGTAIADGTGGWTLTVNLAEGPHTLSAIASDAAGNTSASSASRTVTVDLTAPAMPVITGLTAATDTGASNTDGVTTNATPTITGTAPANARVDLYDGASLLGTTTADGTGAWSFTPGTALAAGNHTITAQAVDAAGNTGPRSVARAIVVEGATPQAPTLIGLTAATDTGSSSTDGITSHTTPTVTGTAAPHAQVQVFDGPTLLGSTTADALGAWSFTPGTALAAGSHSLTATATAAGGGTSASSAPLAVVVTTTGPAATTVLGLVAATDTGSSATDGLTAQTAPTIRGTAGANATVRVFDGGTLLGTTTADGAGAWTFTPGTALTAGAHTITARAIDAAGNVGAVSPATTITIDAIAPNAPVITGLTAATDTGASDTDGVTSHTTPTVTGTAEAGSTVQLFDGGTLLGTVTAHATTGAWSFTPGTALATGSHSLTAIATDAAGNVSATAPAFNMVVTTNAPAAPVIAGLTPATDTGASDTDGVTGLANPVLMGSAPAHATVQVFDGGALVGSATADAAGAWTFAFSALTAGTHTLTATATDAAGRVSVASAARAITVTTGTPGAPVITGLTAASDTGSSSTDGITGVATPTLVGTAEANATVKIFDGGTLLDTVTATATGAWSYTPSAALTAGTHTLTASAVSASGTPGATSAPFSLVVDLTNPAAPVVNGPANGQTADATPTLTGTAEAGSLVKVYDGTTLLGTTNADGTGAWSFTPAANLTEGVHHLSATATDAAGHLSAASVYTPVTVDTTAPAAPILTPPGATSDATPTLTGTAEAGATVRIFDGGTLLGTAIADTHGDWSFTPASDLSLGTHALTARALDGAGNLGPASAAVSLEIEAPAAGYQLGESTGLWFDAALLADGFELSTTIAMADPQETLKLSDVLAVPIASEGILLGGDASAPVGGAPAEAPSFGFYAPDTTGLLLDSDIARHLG